MRKLLLIAIASALSIQYGMAQRGGGRGAPKGPPRRPRPDLNALTIYPRRSFPGPRCRLEWTALCG